MEIFGEKAKLYLGRESRFYELKENKGESRHIFKRNFRSQIVMEMKKKIHVDMRQHMLVIKYNNKI